MLKNDEFRLDSRDSIEGGDEALAASLRLDQFQQDDTIGGGNPARGFMQADACLDVLSVFGEYSLNEGRLLDPIGHVDGSDDMTVLFFLRHFMSPYAKNPAVIRLNCR